MQCLTLKMNNKQELTIEDAGNVLLYIICTQDEYKEGLLSQEDIDKFEQSKSWGWKSVPTLLVLAVLVNIHEGNCTLPATVAHTLKTNNDPEFDTEEQLYGMLRLQMLYSEGLLSQEDIDMFKTTKSWSWESVPTILVVEVLLKIHEDGTASLTKFLGPPKTRNQKKKEKKKEKKKQKKKQNSK